MLDNTYKNEQVHRKNAQQHYMTVVDLTPTFPSERKSKLFSISAALTEKTHFSLSETLSHN